MLSVNLETLAIQKRILNRSLQFHIQPGESWSILGKNGVGKSVLLHHLCGLNTSKSSLISYKNKNIVQMSEKDRSYHLGILTQDPITSFDITVESAIYTVLNGYVEKNASSKKQVWKKLEELLNLLHLQSIRLSYLNQLSGGERQRVCIAMLFAQDPDVFFLDEPTNHLDLSYQIQVLTLFKNRMTDQHKSVVMVIHDMNLAYQFSDHACFLYEDQTHEVGLTKEIFTEEKLSRLYGCPIEKVKKGDRVIWVSGE